MLDIDEMGQKEIQDFLQQLGYGHLGFIHEGKPGSVANALLSPRFGHIHIYNRRHEDS